MEKRRKMKNRLKKFFTTNYDGKGRLEKGEGGAFYVGTSGRGVMKTDVSLYDLGFWNNVKHVLGPYVLLWFIPTRYGITGDGTRFRNRLEHIEEYQSVCC